MAETGKGKKAGSFLYGVLQSIAGAAVTAIFGAVWQKLHSGGFDWLAITGLFLISLAVIGFTVFQNRQHLLAIQNRLSALEKVPHTIFTINGERLDGTPVTPIEANIEADRRRREKAQLESDLWRAQESARLCGEEKRKALREAEELRAQLALFTPLQIEAFKLAKDLREFMSSLGPYPTTPADPEGSDHEAYIAAMNARFQEQFKWMQKLGHGYANRQLGQRITSVVHRAGEEFGLEYASPLLANSAEIGPSYTPDGIPRVAQEMEMIAIWISRKERGEANLIS